MSKYAHLDMKRSRGMIVSLTYVRLDGVDGGVGRNAHNDRLLPIQMRESGFGKPVIDSWVIRKPNRVRGPQMTPNEGLVCERSRAAGVREMTARNSRRRVE